MSPFKHSYIYVNSSHLRYLFVPEKTKFFCEVLDSESSDKLFMIEFKIEQKSEQSSYIIDYCFRKQLLLDQ